MRKTKKYYRDKIDISYQVACEVLPELLLKYGNTAGRMKRELLARSEYLWNYRVDGFYYDRGDILIKIYWQGDSTDGYDWIPLENVLTHDYTISAVTTFDGNRTRVTHGDIIVTRVAVYNAIQEFKNRILT